MSNEEKQNINKVRGYRGDDNFIIENNIIYFYNNYDFMNANELYDLQKKDASFYEISHEDRMKCIKTVKNFISYLRNPLSYKYKHIINDYDKMIKNNEKEKNRLSLQLDNYKGVDQDYIVDSDTVYFLNESTYILGNILYDEVYLGKEFSDLPISEIYEWSRIAERYKTYIDNKSDFFDE